MAVSETLAMGQPHSWMGSGMKPEGYRICTDCVMDTTDSAIVRLIVDDPDKARSLLAREDFPYNEADILAVEIPDESALKAVLAALLEAEVNTHYVYSFIKRPAGKAALALSVDDIEIAAQALNNRGFKVLNQHDISR